MSHLADFAITFAAYFVALASLMLGILAAFTAVDWIRTRKQPRAQVLRNLIDAELQETVEAHIAGSIGLGHSADPTARVVRLSDWRRGA